jgi:hypothetical protein
MWRTLTGLAAAAGALGGAIAVAQPSEHRPAHAQQPAPVAGHSASAGAAEAVGRVAAIAAGQARTLRSDVRHCARRRGAEVQTRCDFHALARAAAGAKLNGVILGSAAPDVRGRACARMASRLRGFMGAIAYLAVDGTRSRLWPGQVRADARAAASVAGHVGRVARPGRCTPGADGPSV